MYHNVVNDFTLPNKTYIVNHCVYNNVKVKNIQKLERLLSYNKAYCKQLSHFIAQILLTFYPTKMR